MAKLAEPAPLLAGAAKVKNCFQFQGIEFGFNQSLHSILASLPSKRPVQRFAGSVFESFLKE
jgi:hypothetical protein